MATMYLQWPQKKKKNFRLSDNVKFVQQVQGIKNENHGKSMRVIANQLHVSGLTCGGQRHQIQTLRYSQ